MCIRDSFRLAAKKDVRSPFLYQALGVAYAVAGDSKRAVRSFKTALTLAPEMKDAVRALSIVLLQPVSYTHLHAAQLREQDRSAEAVRQPLPAAKN